MIIFYKKQFKKIRIQIKDIIFSIKNIELINLNENENNKPKNESLNKSNKLSNKILHEKKKRNLQKKNQNKNNININITQSSTLNYINNNIIKREKKKYNSHAPKKKNKKSLNIDLNKNDKSIINKNVKTEFENEDQSKRKTIEPQINLKNKEKIEKIKNIMKYKEVELNSLSYELAILDDNRNYFEYYLSLLRTKHNIIFIFFNNNDYNSIIIKIDLFIISFLIYYWDNALYYSDNTMDQLYINKGSLDLEYHILQMIYSFLISFSLNFILKYLALSNDNIIKFKNDKTKENINKRYKKLINKLRIKFNLYFVITYIFILFLGYYLCSFCAVLINTQYHLIKQTLISFCSSLVLPFVLCLLPGIFRIPALAKHKKILYFFSKAIQFFL